jgi:hypothetical protein
MNLKNREGSVVLINCKEDGQYLVAGLFFSDPISDTEVVLVNTLGQAVYSVSLPAGVSTAPNPVTSINVALEYKKL